MNWCEAASLLKNDNALLFFLLLRFFVLNLAHFADVVGSFCLLRRQKIRNNNKKEFRLPSLEVVGAFKKRFFTKKGPNVVNICFN